MSLVEAAEDTAEDQADECSFHLLQIKVLLLEYTIVPVPWDSRLGGE